MIIYNLQPDREEAEDASASGVLTTTAGADTESQIESSPVTPDTINKGISHLRIS